ncbi:MAG TPA: hypothetical protein H9721_02370, partial [Candidatus Limosilactobacillus intestinipullorum]|nr:hypothetical protein [Candidatus Limosilactobacillus intestinipullorum]
MVRLDGYNNIKGGWEKTILVLAFDIENRTMNFESSKIVVRFFPFFSNDGLILATIFPNLVKFMV